MIVKDLIGKKSGKLTVISFSHYDSVRKKKFWNCICECGNSKKCITNAILRGDNFSCGCSKRKRGSYGDPLKRLMKNVKKSESCWIYGNKNRHNMFLLEGKHIGAHRASWILHNGEIFGNLSICHYCDTPSCINPNHLYMGTQKDNMQDMIIRGRANRAKGEKSGASKLKNEDVLKMRDLKKYHSYKKIAEMFDMSLTATFFAIKGKTWKNI